MTIEIRNSIENIHCKIAGEFIDAISPYGKYFRHVSPEHIWIFRGHGDYKYKLLPAALRPENEDQLHALAGTESRRQRYPNQNVVQWLAEAKIIYHFLILADSTGLRLPENSHSMRTNLLDVIDKLQYHIHLIELGVKDSNQADQITWPPPAVVPLVALAQHHGLLTRLLDWSRSPYTAAYFAAMDAIDSKSTLLAVWAMFAAPLGWALPTDPLRVGYNLSMPSVQFAPADDRLYFKTAPRGDNPNLHAQDGVFTLYDSGNDSLGNAIQRNPLENRFEFTSPLEFEYQCPCLYHFTLPSSEAGQLLWYLDKNGTNAAKLFPGFDGTARSIRERKYQMQPSSIEI